MSGPCSPNPSKTISAPPCCGSGHLLAFDRVADLAVAAARVSRRQVRPASADRAGLPVVRRGLGVVSTATSLLGLYLTYGLFCGIGTGIVYVGIIGLMVRWFPDRRGLATGVVAAGYGFGAIATTFPIDSMMKSAGYQHTLVVFGIIVGLIGAAAALAMR